MISVNSIEMGVKEIDCSPRLAIILLSKLNRNAPLGTLSLPVGLASHPVTLGGGDVHLKE